MAKNDSTFGKVVTVAESAIVTAKPSELKNGDLILVPGKGKRAVRQHSNGKLTLVFPRSGAVEVDGKKAGSLSDLGDHDPAVIGYVTGGWTDSEAPKVTPKATASKGKLVKGSQEAKDRMAKARAARKGSTTPKAEPVGPSTSAQNKAHFADALDSLASAIDSLRKVSL